MLHILFEFLECCVGVQLKKNAKIEHRVRAGFGAGEGAREWGWERQKNWHGRMQLQFQLHRSISLGFAMPECMGL